MDRNLNVRDEVQRLIKFHKPSERKYQHAQKIILKAQICNQNDFWATKGDYQKFKLDDLFRWASQVNAQKLYLWSNKLHTIIQDIKNVSFPNVKELHLGWNAITSLQLLHHMRMENLTDLQLRDNKITSLKSLRCFNCKNLRILSLRGNRITEVQPLKQMCLKSMKTINFNGNAKVSCFKDLLKIQAETLSYVGITWNLLIEQGTQIEFFASMLKRFNLKRIDRMPQHQVGEDID